VIPSFYFSTARLREVRASANTENGKSELLPILKAGEFLLFLC
jgi:hypothetical protein